MPLNAILRKQISGGPIGLPLLGNIADCYLIEWDKQFIKKLKSPVIEMIFYQHFKGDITIMVEAIEKGLKFEDGEITLDMKEKNKDANKSNDEIAMEVIADIAESADEIIKFSCDIPVTTRAVNY